MKSSDSKKFYTEVIYSSVIFAQSAQRLMKVLAASKISSKQKTWEVLFHMAYTTSFTDIAKVIGDKSKDNVDIEELLDIKDYPESKRVELIKKWAEFKANHSEAIETILSIRSNISAHFSKDIQSVDDSKNFVHNTEPIQIMTENLLLFIEQLPWFEQSMKLSAPEYTDFRDELNFELNEHHQVAIDKAFQDLLNQLDSQ